MPGPLANAPRKPVGTQTERRKELADTEAKRKILRQLQSVFSPLCFSFANKIETLRVNGSGIEGEPYAPYDLRNALLMERTPDLYDRTVSPFDVMPVLMDMNERRSFIDFVQKLRTGASDDMRDFDRVREMLPVEVADRFYLTLGNPEFLVSTVAVPVGEYGETFALDILRASTILKRAAKELIADEAMKLKESNPAIVGRTLLDLQRSGQPRAGRFNSPLATLQDGIDSIADAIALALGQRNGGPDDPMEALRAITQQRIVEALSLRLAFGVLAPSRASNALFENPVVWEDGTPALASEFRQQLSGQRGAMTRVFRDNENNPNFASNLVTAMGCPVGHPIDLTDDALGAATSARGDEANAKQSGVQALSETFLAVMEDLAARRAAGIIDEFPIALSRVENKPSRYSTIPPDIALDKLIADVDSFRDANDVLRGLAEIEHSAYRLQCNASANPSAELISGFKAARGGVEICEIEAELINKAFAANPFELQLERIVADNDEWRKGHPNLRATQTAEGDAAQLLWAQREARQRNQARKLEDARQEAEVLLRQLRKKTEEIDSRA